MPPIKAAAPRLITASEFTEVNMLVGPSNRGEIYTKLAYSEEAVCKVGALYPNRVENRT